MTFAAVKLVDIAARSLFLLLALFSLKEEGAGQFGLIVTLVTWFSFLIGYERYVDLQRSLIDRPIGEVASLLRAAGRFFAVNGAILLPILVLLLVKWVGLPSEVAFLYVVVAVSEHLSQEFYRLGVVLHQYRVALVPILAKNVALCVGMGILASVRDGSPTIIDVSWLWATISGIGLFLVVLVAIRTEQTEGQKPRGFRALSLRQQYGLSLTHFKLGLLALVSLQLDRLVVGAILPLDQGGLYFRHVMLVSFLYSGLTVLSYNRVLPTVYSSVQGKRPEVARSIVEVERKWVLILCVVGVVALAGLTLGNFQAINDVGLSTSFLSILLVAFALRICGDYNALQLNAAHREADVLRAFMLASVPSLAVTLGLCLKFGLAGAVASFALGAGFYLVTSQFFLRHAR
jgi:O-antigen/teichoic acid export membrane protein